MNIYSILCNIIYCVLYQIVSDVFYIKWELLTHTLQDVDLDIFNWWWRRKKPDVIPDEWRIKKCSCWYPKNLKSNVINILARKKSTPDHTCGDWKCYLMKILENNISKHDMSKLFSNKLKMRLELSTEHFFFKHLTKWDVVSTASVTNYDHLSFIFCK